jgi:hypothetical protein
MTRLSDVTWTDTFDICLRLRESDKLEVYNQRAYDSAYQLSWEMSSAIVAKGRGVIAWHQGRATAVFGFVQGHPGVWDIIMFGTDEYRAVAFALLRWCRREANDILSTSAGHRLQCDARVGHEDAHRLIQSMGGRPESLMRRYGKDRSDYIRYVWLRGEDDAILKPHYVRADRVPVEHA